MIARSTNLTILLVVLFLTSCSQSLQGQGQGTPGATGLVPRIQFDHRAVGVANTLTLQGLAPGANVTLIVSFSENLIPLQSLGYGPAIFGPDLNSPFGAVSFSGLTPNAAGEIILPFTGAASVAHVPFHIQAYSIDSGAPFGGVSFSDYEVLSFGFDQEILPLRVDFLGSQLWAEIFPYGAQAAPIPSQLLAAVPRDLLLASSNDMASAREDVATPSLSLAGPRVVVLADSTTLHGVSSPNNETGFLLVRPNGTIDLLAWAQGTAIDPAFDNTVAVSDHDPYLAFTSLNPLPEYGGASLLVWRTDGWNVPGSHLSYVAITAPLGITIEPTSLCFLSGALFFGDGATTLFRLDLNSWLVTPVIFPVSGGQVPIYVDETVACAANGSALALGAGVDKFNHDVYVVKADGTATNLTNLVGDYEDPGIGDNQGMQMAMSAAGDYVAYMRTVLGTELFVKGVSAGSSEIHVTHPAQYIDSIDTIVGLGFKATGDLVYAAGKDILTVDTYRAVIPSVTPVVGQIANETGTSGFLAPIYDLGATLTPLRNMSTTSGALVQYSNSAGPDRLQLIGGTAQTLPLDVETLKEIGALPNCIVVVDELATGAQRVRELSTVTTTLQSSVVTVPGSSLVAFDVRFGKICSLIQTPAGSILVTSTGNGLTSSAGPPGALDGGMRLSPDGRVFAATKDLSTGVFGLWSRDPVTGIWSNLSTTNQTSANTQLLR